MILRQVKFAVIVVTCLASARSALNPITSSQRTTTPYVPRWKNTSPATTTTFKLNSRLAGSLTSATTFYLSRWNTTSASTTNTTYNRSTTTPYVPRWRNSTPSSPSTTRPTTSWSSKWSTKVTAALLSSTTPVPQTTTSATVINSKWISMRLTQTPTSGNNTAAALRTVLPISKRAPQTVRYDYWHVYRIEPRNINDLSVIKPYEENRTHCVFIDGVFYGNQQIQVLVSPNLTETFKRSLDTVRMRYRISSTNAQDSLDRSDAAITLNATNDISPLYNWRQFYNLETTYNWLRSLATLYPQRAKLFSIGKSFEGRDMLGIRISNGNSSNRIVFIAGGMHGREWISPATATFIIQQLTLPLDPRVKNISEAFDWYVVPHTNPDSYEYTVTTDRLWRKTRTPYSNGCFGADPDRNFDFHWNEIPNGGACNERYAGPRAFSEVETKALSAFLTTLRDRLALYISIGAYGQYLLVPYGHTVDVPQNYANLKLVLDVSLQALNQRYGTEYIGGTIRNLLYPSSGSSIEWMHGAMGIGHSYAYELRPAGNVEWDGFLIPANQILPTSEETLDSVFAMVNEVARQLS